jgi:uncharacterized membrane protein YphA (DoxX/SURF4 family)
MTRPRSVLESILLLAVRLTLAGVFGFAAWSKLTNPQSFADAVKAFRILPDHLTTLATFTLPWAELICALLLLLGFSARAAALVLAIQLAAFIAGIISVMARHLAVECGCFGKYDLLCSGPLGWCNVGQNALLAAGALLIFLRGPGRFGMDRSAPCCSPQ